jgi:PLP dependent protein
MIEEKLAAVLRRIEDATRAAGRPAASVRLLAVSKKQSAEAIRSAYAAGQRDFGENYVQELLEKREQLADLSELRWHLVGPLQRNKARAVVPAVTSIHSVDSIALVQALGRHASGQSPARSRPLEVFLQVNISREPQKGGCDPAELGALLSAVQSEAALRAVGLMAVPQADLGAEATRAQFDAVVALQTAHGRELLPELSLGMSHDLELAIAAGSTWVRVGTDVFGAR